MMTHRLLIVDDQAPNRGVLKDFCLILGHEPIVAEDGAKALELMKEQTPDLILSDILMPRMDGFQFLAAVKQNPAWRLIPFIMITALDDLDSLVRCVQSGADDYLVKPFNKILLKARIDACLEKKRLHDQSQRYQREIEDYNRTLETRIESEIARTSAAHFGMIFGLSKLAESRDPETGSHLERMAEYCRVICTQLQMLPKYQGLISEHFIRDLHLASPMHDIGKVGIPDHILLKPGKLTPEEFEIMKTHALIGARTLRDVDARFAGNTLVKMGIQVAESHHEKWDGTGYPHGLKGEQIPLPGRILAIGDVYDALTSRRCYKEAFPHEKARAIILEGRGTHFDPDIVDAFTACEDAFRSLRQRLA